MDDSTKTRSDSTKDESKDDVSGYDSGFTIGTLPQIPPAPVDDTGPVPTLGVQPPPGSTVGTPPVGTDPPDQP